MDVFEAVDSRMSCRWFLDKPVDAKIVRDLIARAARAASGGNLQPWQVYALTGAPLAELKRQVAAFIAGRDPRHIDAEYPIYPATMWEPYKGRREYHGVQLYGALGIDRGDAAARLEQYKRNLEFFNAPVALFVAIERKFGPGQWADLGGYIHALMFLARGYGLDSCAAGILGAHARGRPPVRRHAGGADAVLRASLSATATAPIRPTFPLPARGSLGSFAGFSGLIEARPRRPLPACGERVGVRGVGVTRQTEASEPPHPRSFSLGLSPVEGFA